jgi:5'-nucleotidase
MSRQTEHRHRRLRRLSFFGCSALLGAFSLVGAFSLAVAAAPFARADSIPLRLIAFNDFHGRLEPDPKPTSMPDPSDPAKKTVNVPTGGAAWMAGLISKLRGEAPNSVTFSSGDMISAAPLVSTLFRHESTIAVMNAIGLDFAIVGNHEFDGGVGELRRIASGGCAANDASSPFVSCALGGSYAGAKFPYLAANVLGPDGQPVFAPTLIKEFGGVKVGFIGVVTRALPSMVSPAGFAGLKVLDEAETLNKQADELNRQGVEAIVAVVHEGGAAELRQDDECANKSGEIFAIADKLSPHIDLVFSAHTHQRYNCVIDTPNQHGLRVIQAGSYGRALSVIDVELNTATHRIERDRSRSRIVPVVNQSVGGYTAAPSDPAVAKLVSDYTAQSAATADRPVGRIAGPIDLTPAAASPTAIDSPAGHLIADAQLTATQDASAGAAQIAFVNGGGVRAPLPCQATPPCTATYGQAFTMQPFGNTLVSMTLTGEQLKALLEEQFPPEAKEPHFMAPSRGFTYAWKRSAPFGQRVSDLTLDGAPVRPEARYRITVNSFMAEGGDNHKRLTEGGDRVGGPLDVDALVDFLKTHDGADGHALYAADTTPRIRLAD